MKKAKTIEMTAHFKLEDVKKALAASHASAINIFPSGKTTLLRGLVIANDDGLYLAPNIPGEKTDVCAYAKGCHPDNDPDAVTAARELTRPFSQGDDFAEFVPEDAIVNAIDDGCSGISVVFGNGEYWFVFDKVLTE